MPDQSPSIEAALYEYDRLCNAGYGMDKAKAPIEALIAQATATARRQALEWAYHDKYPHGSYGLTEAAWLQGRETYIAEAIRALAADPRFHSGNQVLEHYVPGYKRPEPDPSPYQAPADPTQEGKPNG